MALRKTFVTAEMNDGTVVEDQRIIAADKVHAEHLCTKNNWPLRDGPRLAVAMTYAAMKRTGHTDANDVGDFLEQLVDYVLSNDDEDADEDTDTPT